VKRAPGVSVMANVGIVAASGSRDHATPVPRGRP
jgi:hypothetical protein